MGTVDPGEHGPNIVPASGAEITISYSRRTVKMHHVTQTELEAMASLGNSVNLAFLGISVGSLVAFVITLATVDIANPAKYASFVGLMWISAVASLYFAVRSLIDARSAKRRLREIVNSDEL
jgi:hypothetical protein